MQLLISRENRPTSKGWTLMEMLVSVTLGSLVFTVIGYLTIFTANSFSAMGNYADLDRASRNTLDVMSREIRGAKSVGSWNTSNLTLTNADGTLFSYNYDSSAATLTRKWGSETTVLLSGCDYFYFHIYQRNPTNNFSFPYYSTNSPYVTKLVDVSWKCSRKILGQKVNTESVQTAKIVIRN